MWDTGSVATMAAMFYNATYFDGDVSSLDTSNVIDMQNMFKDATSFNGDLSKWDTSKVENMYMMFSGASSFSSDISAWDTGSVENMESMFYNAQAFDSDLSQWNTTSVQYMDRMFYNATSFGQCGTINFSHEMALIGSTFVNSNCTLSEEIVQFEARMSPISPIPASGSWVRTNFMYFSFLLGLSLWLWI